MVRFNLDFSDIILLKQEVDIRDEGTIVEIYNYERLLGFNIKNIFITEFESKFRNEFLLRGFYIQDAPYFQNLLLRCRKGCCNVSILDVRKTSATYGKKIDVILSRENNELLYIPYYYAIALLSLEKETIVSFKSDSILSDNINKIINPFDPKIGCNWPDKQLTVSVRDATAPYLDEVEFHF